jgi:hypothetical protein
MLSESGRTSPEDTVKSEHRKESDNLERRILFEDEKGPENIDYVIDSYFDPKKVFGKDFPYSYNDLVSVSRKFASDVLKGEGDIVVEHGNMEYRNLSHDYAARINKQWRKSRSPIDEEAFKNLDQYPESGFFAYAIPNTDMPPPAGYIVQPLRVRGRNAPDNFEPAVERFGKDKLVKEFKGGHVGVLPSGLFFLKDELPQDISLEGSKPDQGDFQYRVQKNYSPDVISRPNIHTIRWARKKGND